MYEVRQFGLKQTNQYNDETLNSLNFLMVQ
jgi:hypothetical protein